MTTRLPASALPAPQTSTLSTFLQTLPPDSPAHAASTPIDLRELLDTCPDGIVKLDRDWRIVYLNRRASQLLSGSGPVLGRNHWEAFPASAFEGSPWVKHYYSSMDHGTTGTFEEYYPEPLNLWLNITSYPATDGIIIYFQDISARKRAEDDLRRATEALTASEQELRWTVELNAQIPWTADPDGNILDFSNAWLDLTGLSREQALGDGWTSVPHPDDLPRMAEAWTRALTTAGPYEVEHRIRTASGEFRWMRTSAFPRLAPDGSILKWYGTTEDIHNRKLGEEALIQSEKLAAVGRLAASIAHEINNPLESVTNLLYLASHTRQPDEIHAYLGEAERELRRVAAISNQTLRFHKQAASPTPVTARDFIESVVSIHHGRVLNNRIQTLIRIRSEVPVLCFEGEIRQVLANLVGNAIDAMQPNGGRLHLRGRQGHNWRTGEPGLLLTIADTGPGISPEIRQKIFDPFFTTKGLAGTGLGLWVSQEIVNRHRGALHVRSSQNPKHPGTTFTLFLPSQAATR